MGTKPTDRAAFAAFVVLDGLPPQAEFGRCHLCGRRTKAVRNELSVLACPPKKPGAASCDGYPMEQYRRAVRRWRG